MAEKDAPDDDAQEPAKDAIPDDQVVTMGDIGTDDPDALAERMAKAQAGVDDDPAKEPPDKPGTKSVTIAGQTFEVTPEVAAAMEAQQAVHQQEVAGLRQPVRQPPTEPDQPPSWGDKMFTDPEGFVKDLREDISKGLRAEYGAAQRRQDFWDDFYRKNEDLRPYKGMVETTLRENNAALGPLPANQAAVRLGDLTRESIMGLVSDFGSKPKGDGKANRTTLESGKGPAPKKPSASPDSEGEGANVRSLTDAIKQRRKAQKKASTRTA